MPCDIQGKYYVTGDFGERRISRMTCSIPNCTQNSTHLYPTPYRSPTEIMERVDGPGQSWYQEEARDLHLRDFVWHTYMQTARRLQDCTERFSNHDRVLECLLAEGTFDREEPNTPDAQEEFAMAHSSAMVQRLLMRIKQLETEVSFQFIVRTKPQVLTFLLVEEC